VTDFEQYLETGQIPLPPSFYNRVIEDNPSLQPFVFAAGSEISSLARSMECLINIYCNVAGNFSPRFLFTFVRSFCYLASCLAIPGASCACAGQNEEVCGQNMTAFTARLWISLQHHAPARFKYNLKFDRNKKPSQATADITTTGVR
jgi:hypothetical protein